jgi:hypothetical protein
MRRYLILAFLFCLTLPFDLAVTGCYRNPAADFCQNLGYGAKNTAVASITLLPNTTGLSVAYGETGNTQSPTAKSCTNSSVSVSSFAWGTTDMTIADINPTTGEICAGTWNRLTNGGIPAYTTCLPTNKQGIAYITASASNITSNTVAVYVHPAIANVQLSSTPVTETASKNGNSCLSQGQTAQLDVTAYTAASSTVPLCAPNVTGVPSCSTVLGHLTYAAVVPTITTIDFNGLATANLPGSTEITATTNSGSTTGGTTTSSAGTFYTCPAETIALTANGSTTANVTPNNPQAITATVTDINGNTITGLALTYASTQPQNVPISSAGSITATFPSTASVTAICQPPGCNPAPINQIGINGNGTPIVSNPLLINASGTSSTVLYMASPKSQYFSAIDFTIGGVTAPVKLPYVPNSMILSPTGTTIYFGSYRELMTVSTTNNTIGKEDPTVPGVVLAVSPDGNTLLINDQNRQVFYLYSNAGTSSSATGTGTSTSGGSTATAGGIVTTFGGLGQHAQFSSDGQTVYIVGNTFSATGTPIPTLFIHNVFTGWSTDTLTAGVGENHNVLPATSITNACPAFLSGANVPPTQLGTSTDTNTLYNKFCGPDLSVAVPSIGPFISGSPASGSFGFCPDATANPVGYYPNAGGLQVSTDRLVATTNSEHVIGASDSSTLSGPQLTDSTIKIPTGGCTLSAGTATTPPKSLGLTIDNTGNKPYPLTGYGIDNINQVIASPDSTLAFVTYASAATATPTGGAQLPAYKIPASGTAGTLVSVKLSGTAIAPIAGVFSPNTQTFYASTTGDNLVHLISTSSLTDTQTIVPALPDTSGNITPAQFLAVRPRSLP